MVIFKFKTQDRTKLLSALGPLGWLAFAVSTSLGRLGNPDLDFVIGFLTGFALVANLAYIYAVTAPIRENRRQK